MKRSGTTNRFWWVLGTLNVLAMVYPNRSCHDTLRAQQPLREGPEVMINSNAKEKDAL
jgi:hypothetical protein